MRCGRLPSRSDVNNVVLRSFPEGWCSCSSSDPVIKGGHVWWHRVTRTLRVGNHLRGKPQELRKKALHLQYWGSSGLSQWPDLRFAEYVHVLMYTYNYIYIYIYIHVYIYIYLELSYFLCTLPRSCVLWDFNTLTVSAGELHPGDEQAKLNLLSMDRTPLRSTVSCPEWVLVHIYNLSETLGWIWVS